MNTTSYQESGALFAPPASVEPTSRRVTVGVAITAYQIAHLLPQALSSVAAQTDAPDRIVVCDDGSTDNVADAVAPFSDHIRLIRQENQGPAGAKNTAVEACGTEYAILLDGDDTWEPRRVERLRAAAQERPDLAILTTDAFVDRGAGIEESTYYESTGFSIDMSDVRTSILRNNFIFSHAMVHVETWQRSGRFNVALRGSDDRDCWTRMILDGALPGIILEPLATYFHRADSVSDNRSATNHARALMFRQVLARTDLNDEEMEVAKAGLKRDHAMALTIDARKAIITGASDARQRCWAVVGDPWCPWPSRFKALMMSTGPRAARKILRSGP